MARSHIYSDSSLTHVQRWLAHARMYSDVVISLMVLRDVICICFDYLHDWMFWICVFRGVCLS